MAKQRDDSSEIKKLLDGLYKVVQTTNASSQEQIKINRELLKVMSLLQSGFVKNEEDARKLIDDVREGLEIQDDYAVKWAKARKAEQKDIDKILDKFRELEKIQEDEIDNAEDYLDLLSDRYDLVESEYDITKSLLRSQKDILKVIGDNRRVYEKIGGTSINIDETLTKIVKKRVEFDNLFSGMNDAFYDAETLVGKIKDDTQALISNLNTNLIDIPFNFNPLTDDLNKEIQKVIDTIDLENTTRLAGLTEFFNKNTKLQENLARQMAADFGDISIKINVDTGEITNSVTNLKLTADEYKKTIEELDTIVLKNNISESLTAGFGELNSLLGIGIGRTEEQNARLAELIKPMGLSTQILIEQIKLKNDDIDLIKSAILGEQAKANIIMKNLDLLKSTEHSVRKIGDGFDYISSILPQGVSNLLGFSNISTILMNSHQKGIEALTNKLIEGGTRASALKTYYKEMTPALKSVLNPLNLLVVGTALLFKYVAGMTDKLKSMSSEMNVSLLQSKQLLDVQLDILTTSSNQFTTLRDIQDIQTELIGSSGKVFSAMEKGNSDLMLSISEMGKVFGYSVTEATKIHKVFAGIGADDSMAVNLQTNLGLMSELVGLSPQIINKDLVDASEEVFTYFLGMPEQAAKAAINVRRMGMSLKQAGQIAQKMLSLDEFMTDMYELNAMSNRGIDFSEAFDLGLSGDIEGMTKSIMENIGSVEEFSKMDYLTRTKIAKTLGMTNEDLTKSVRMHEQMANFSGVEKDNLEANIDRLGDISKLNKDQIRQRLEQLQSTDRLSIAWDKIKGVLIKSLIPLIESFADGIDAIMPLIDIIIGAFKVVGTVIKPIAFLIKGFLTPLKWIGDGIHRITDYFFGTSDSVKGINDSLESLKTPLQYIGTFLGSLYIGKKLFSGISSIKDKTTDLTSSIGNIFSKAGDNKPAIEEVNKSIAAINPTIDSVTNNSKQIVKEVSKQTVAATGEIVSATNTASTNIDKIKTKSKSLFSNLGASEGFKTVTQIGTKAVAMMAIDQARKLSGFGKTIENGITDNSSGIKGAMSDVFSIGGVLLGGYLDTAISKVFEKKLESKVEKGLSPIKDKIKGLFSKKITPEIEMPSPQDLELPNKSEIPKEIGKVEPIKKLSSDVEIPKKVEEITTTKKTEIENTKKSTAKFDKLTTQKVETPKGVDKVESIFTKLSTTIKNVWKGLKSTLNEIINFITSSFVKLSKGIGSVIENILSGIAKGLNKFNTSAVKGAASLLIVSGALWVTSKAMQNFASVSWSDVGKGIVTLGALSLAGMALGKMQSEMVKGSIAIAILGASLIPLAYAMKMFNDIEWSSLVKGAAALIGLAVIGNVLAPLTPLLVSASVGIALLGASIIPLAYSLKMLNDVEWSSILKGIVGLAGIGVVGTVLGAVSPMIIMGSAAIGVLSVSLIAVNSVVSMLSGTISNIKFDTIAQLTNELEKLTLINMFDVALGITAISAALFSLSTSQTFGNISKGFSSIMGGGIVGDLEKIAESAEPLKMVSDSILILTSSIERLNKISSEIDFSKLSDDININIDKKVNLLNNPTDQIEVNQNLKPIKQPIVQPLNPPRESTAQNVNITKIVDRQKELEITRQNNIKDELEYSSDSLSNLSTKRLEQLMQQMITILSNQQTSQEITLDGYSVGKIVKKQFNN
jgi:hypothetical protein